MRIVALATGVGNVRSVVRALARSTSAIAGTEIIASADPDVARAADVLVVPGQGSFGAFAAALDRGLRETVLEKVRAGAPYLGICLGLQILFEKSDEAPAAEGLALLRGQVHQLAAGFDTELGRPYPLPHVGWNRADVLLTEKAGSSIVAPHHYYFAHSYAAVPENPSVILTTTSYGEATFASAVQKDNITGFQFHPEKSQSHGLALLERFFSGL